MSKKKTAIYLVLREFDFSPGHKHYIPGEEDTLPGWTPEQVAHALQAGLVVLAEDDSDSGEVVDG